MEIPRAIVTKAAIFTSAVTLAACGTTIVENDEIASCKVPDGTLLEATTDPEAENYTAATDPAILASKMSIEAEDEASRIRESNSKKKLWENQTYARLVVGIGEIACQGENRKVYLTTEGVQLSSAYPRD